MFAYILFTVIKTVTNIKTFSRPPTPSIIPTGQTAQGGLFIYKQIA